MKIIVSWHWKLSRLGSWIRSVYSGCFVNSGKIHFSPPESDNDADQAQNLAMENLKRYDAEDVVQKIANGGELASRFSCLKSNLIGDRPAEFVSSSGFGLSLEAIKRAFDESSRLGVKFHFGDDGKVLAFKEHEVTTSSGKTFSGDKLILCCGAANSFLVNFEGQVRSLGEFVAHIKLTDNEYELYKDLPIIHKPEQGFYFPPDPKTKMIKLVVQNIRASNSRDGDSIPKYENLGKMKGIPDEATKVLRELLSDTIPELKDRPFVNCLICWCANTYDMNWIITKLPTFNDIYVCGGDSGHAFKFLPIAGKHVADLLESKLEATLEHKWRWKPNPMWPTKWPAGCPDSVNVELDDLTWS